MANEFKRACSGLPLVDAKALELGSVLGQGATSTVVRSIFQGKACAAKVLKSEHSMGYKLDRGIIAELSVLSKLGPHPNIINCYGVIIDGAPAPIIILELIEGKDLERYTSMLKPGFDLGKSTIQKWSLDLLSALEYLHDRDPIIIHCDVKPANLLVTSSSRGSSLKLTDFGISKTVDRDKRLTAQHKANEGSARYRAPEVLSTSNRANYTEKADIYSAALVIYFILTGRVPDNDVTVDLRWRPTLLLARMRWRGMADLLEHMWAHDAERRPEAGECGARVRRLGEADAGAPAPRPGCYAGMRRAAQRRLVA